MNLSCGYTLFFVVVAAHLLTGAAGETICRAPDKSKVEAALSRYSFPRGSEQAGNYSEDSNAHTLPDCVTSCCRAKQCNKAFFYKGVCFLIHCNASYPEGCEAESRPADEELRNVYLVHVRSIDETVSSNTWVKGIDNDARYPGSSEPASLAISTESPAAVAESQDKSARPSSDRGGRICQLNLIDDCPPLEHCVASSGRRRHGICMCNSGYVRMSGDGCHSAEGDTPADVVHVVATIASPAATSVAQPLREAVPHTEGSTTSPKPNPTPVSYSTTSQKAIADVFVRILGNTLIHWPNSSVKLAADVVPEASPSDPYSYDWALVPHDSIGGSTAHAVKSSQRVLEVNGLKPGAYLVTLTVSAAGGHAVSSAVNVTITAAQRDGNRAPLAIISDANKTVTLPLPLLMINGSLSSDDVGIVSYLWTRSMTSPAAGDVVGNSDHEPILWLTNVVAGVYHWSLDVMDNEGIVSVAHSVVTVRQDPFSSELVELVLEVPSGKFSVSDKQTLCTQLGLLLYKPLFETRVVIHQVATDWRTGKLVVTFFVRDSPVDNLTGTSGSDMIRNAVLVTQQLKDKLTRNSDVVQYAITSVDTVACSNNCSGHGQCEPLSRKCVCDTYWTANLIEAYVAGRSNCDWGILYILAIAVGSLVALSALVLMCRCCYRRCCRRASKRKLRVYRLLNDLDDFESGKGTADVKCAKKSALSAPMLTPESDASTDDDDGEDTVFIKGGKDNVAPLASNGHKAGAGEPKRSNTMLTENNLKNKTHA